MRSIRIRISSTAVSTWASISRRASCAVPGSPSLFMGLSMYSEAMQAGTYARIPAARKAGGRTELAASIREMADW